MGDAPEIIHATVNGMSTSIPSGRRQLIGGWGETDDKPHAVRYVRADLYDALRAQVEALRDALTRLRDPAPGVKHLPPWAYGIIVPALAKPTGSPDGQQ